MRGISISFVVLLLGLTSVIPSRSGTRQNARGEQHKSGDMVLVPGGEFIMGAANDTDDNRPHRVHVDSFYMDKYEVTNAQYLEFCKATDRKLPFFWGMEQFHSGPDFPNHPVVGLSWVDANAYAEWCGKRLPTEAEWEYAARGGLVSKGFPNGDELDPKSANFTRSELGGTVPVGTFPENGYGLHDMAGNVAEWVADYYRFDYYQKGPQRNPKGPEKGKFRVFRGGGFHSGAYCSRVSHRNALPHNWLDFNVGFRCAKYGV
jgi:iron(II)-dependent oxidoreductase